MVGENQSVAWEAHVGGFLAGLFAFNLFDPIGTWAAPQDASIVQSEPAKDQ